MTKKGMRVDRWLHIAFHDVKMTTRRTEKDKVREREDTKNSILSHDYILL